MDYDPESAPGPLDKAAQKRAVDAVLISGLAGVALGGVLLGLIFFAPGVFEQPNAPAFAWGALGVAALIHGLFQFHYLMRFMWGRGEYVTMMGPDWGDHSDYFTALLIVSAAAIVPAIALAGLNTLLGRG